MYDTFTAGKKPQKKRNRSKMQVQEAVLKCLNKRLYLSAYAVGKKCHVTWETASKHLVKLYDMGLVECIKQDSGKHKDVLHWRATTRPTKRYQLVVKEPSKPRTEGGISPK